MDRNQLRIAITTILKSSTRPLKAKEIREAYCRRNRVTSVTTKEINSILYSELHNSVKQDDSYRWSLRNIGRPINAPRRKRHGGSGRERAMQHIEEAKQLSELLGGTDVDVKEYFFNLTDSELESVLDEYEERYGTVKREYAEEALPSWRLGRRKMSGMVAERLFNLLPPRMPLPTKYEMVQTLWKKYSPTSNEAFVVGPNCKPADVVNAIEQQLLDNITQYKIPPAMENRFIWLSSGDVMKHQQLLNHALEAERKIITDDARTRTQIILGHFNHQTQWTERIYQEYTIGSHKVELFFDPAASGIQKGRPAPQSQARAKASEGTGCLLVISAIIAVSILLCLSAVVAHI